MSAVGKIRIAEQNGDYNSDHKNDTGAFVLKLVIGCLCLALLVLQYRLWVGEGSLADASALSDKVAAQNEKNAQMALDNERLAAEVAALKNGLGEVEARAREELGMIKENETFYLMVDE